MAMNMVMDMDATPRRVGDRGGRRGARAHRSPTDRVIRGFLALATAFAGWFAVSNSLAQVIARSDAERGHQLAPWDGRIAARLATTQFVGDDDPKWRAAAARLARKALSDDPTTVQAVTTLGLNAQAGGNLALARRMFSYSQTLSRRDFTTQLWAIEDAVARGDVSGAISHYDIALRTSKTAPDVLYPVLASAISDPAIRKALVARLRTRPVWFINFINHVSLGDALPQAAAALFVDLKRAGVDVPDPATAAVVNRLISAGDFAAAWRYYATIRGVTDPSKSRDPDFSSSVQAPSVFDWLPTSDPGVTTSVQRSESGGFFDYAVSPGFAGVILQQQQAMPAGRYRIEGQATGIDDLSDALPYWAVTCRDGRELGRVGIPASQRGPSRFLGMVEVPANCPSQTLALVTRISDRVGGTEGKIDRILMQRVR